MLTSVNFTPDDLWIKKYYISRIKVHSRYNLIWKILLKEDYFDEKRPVNFNKYIDQSVDTNEHPLNSKISVLQGKKLSGTVNPTQTQKKMLTVHLFLFYVPLIYLK